MGGAAAYIGGFAFSLCVLLFILSGGWYAMHKGEERDENDVLLIT